MDASHFVAQIMFTLTLVQLLVGKSCRGASNQETPEKMTHIFSFHRWVLRSKHTSSSLCLCVDTEALEVILFFLLLFVLVGGRGAGGFGLGLVFREHKSDSRSACFFFFFFG